LKNREIQNLSAGQIIWDEKIRGLFVQANLSGTKTFKIIYRNRQKKQRKLKIGSYGTMSLDAARQVAQELLLRVARGEDPVDTWREEAEELTINRLMLKALKEYWNTPRYLRSGLFKSILLAFKKNFGPIGAYKLSEINVRKVDSWHKSMEKTPIQANRCLAYLSTALNWAIKQDFTQIKNPCGSVKKFPARKRARYATPDEIKKIAAYLEANFEQQPLSTAYLYLILTTGTRPSAIPRLMWKNLEIKTNAEGQEIGLIKFFGKTTAKTGEAETLILPPKTLSMIMKLPKTGEYIVPMNRSKRLWARIQKEFGLQDLWARDLRRTYATVGLSGGVPLSKIGELLNHRCWETTKTYAKLMDEQRIASAMAVAKNLDEIIGH